MRSIPITEFFLEIVDLNSLVHASHPYRKFFEVIDFEACLTLIEPLSNEGNIGANGYGPKQLFKFLLLQFMEDNSDRENERFLQENTAAKWFCGLRLNDKSPDHTTFCVARQRIGTKRLSKIFSNIKIQLKDRGLMSEVFTFVDAAHLISKANLWEERDKGHALKIEKLNNETLPKVAFDKQARIGCKGKKKYWYGYKQHTSVDMQSGLINKIAISPANETDAQGLSRICPNQGAVYGDKGYCTNPATKILKAKGCHNATIKKNNMIGKNKDLDRWYSGIRSPYERVFSKRNKRVRYKGVAKNQFRAFMDAICFNLRRIIVLQT